MSSREAAFRLLQRIELHDEFAAALLAGEPGFVREVVLGVLRWRERLDFVIAALADRPAKRIDQRVLQILRAAVFEVMFLDSAKYAVVNEFVSIAAQHANRSRGFVNAVLRSAAAQDLRRILPESAGERPAVEWSHPRWLLEKWARLFGADRAESIARSNQQPSYADVLVNTRKVSIEEAKAILEAKGLAFSTSALLPNMFRLQGSSAELRQEVESGVFHLMDEGSALVATLVRPAGGAVLDAAAAPGGKSLVLGLAGHEVISSDVSPARLALLRNAARRFGAEHLLLAGDATRPPFRGGFDTILLDAPCSGTGTLRKNPEIRWRLDRDCFAGFAALQRTLLTSLLPFARRELIYSTCSLEPEENDAVIEAVLSEHPEFERFDLSGRMNESTQRWVENGVLRLTPESDADGFTAFGLRRLRSENQVQNGG